MPKLFGRRHKAPKSANAAKETKHAVREARREVRLPKGGDEPSVDFTQLGQQVAKVLETAKDAAEKMKLAAQAEAEQLRKTIEEQARVEREAAKATAERADAEAASIRADAEQQSKEVREQADDYASKTREAADAKAAAVLARAEKQASAEEDTSRERRRALDEGVTRTEERLRQLVAGLYELAGGLGELVPPHENGKNGDSESLADHPTQYVGEPRSRSRESEII
jgi:hemerythrin-like domain-containing protein